MFRCNDTVVNAKSTSILNRSSSHKPLQLISINRRVRIRELAGLAISALAPIALRHHFSMTLPFRTIYVFTIGLYEKLTN